MYLLWSISPSMPFWIRAFIQGSFLEADSGVYSQALTPLMLSLSASAFSTMTLPSTSSAAVSAFWAR
jgi:hypothetical protein